MTDESDEVKTVIDTVGLISKKWHPAIIQQLLDGGPLRYNELRESLDGISSKVLTESLDDLVEKGLVDRTVISESPKHVEYTLTPHGRDLQGVIEALADWGDRHLDGGDVPTVLIVDDDPRLAGMHAEWLSDRYDITQCYSGADAIRELTAEVDVVLLDRRMAGTSGDDVATWIDTQPLDVGIVLLTAVEPDFDVIGLEFDDYIVKPGRREEVRATVEDVLQRRRRPELVRAYLSLTAKRALLRAELTPNELADSQEYTRLLARIDRLSASIADDPPDDQEVTEAMEAMVPHER